MKPSKRPKWSYGITTTPTRRHDLLPTALKTLEASGFPCPRLFIDGAVSDEAYQELGLVATVHNPAIGIVGNWILGMWELYAREPSTTFFAMFQDDITICRGVREYIEKNEFPDKGYLNLCTYPQNEELADGQTGWYHSNQRGRGAQALVFSRRGLMALLSLPSLINKLQDARRHYRSIDGKISICLKKEGYFEFVHSPSLVDHIGFTSSMGNQPQPRITNFPGCDYNVLEGAKP